MSECSCITSYNHSCKHGPSREELQKRNRELEGSNTLKSIADKNKRIYELELAIWTHLMVNKNISLLARALPNDFEPQQEQLLDAPSSTSSANKG